MFNPQKKTRKETPSEEKPIQNMPLKHFYFQGFYLHRSIIGTYLEMKENRNSNLQQSESIDNCTL